MDLQFTTRIYEYIKRDVLMWRRDRELGVSSFGRSKEKALKNLKDAVGLFLRKQRNGHSGTNPRRASSRKKLM
jgi:hypothetical protein